MNCPSCNKPLTEHFQTIFTCDNLNCRMIHAILSRAQWEHIASLKNALLEHHTGRVTLQPFDQTYRRDEQLLKGV